jgi:hypothetical protein
MEPVTAAGAQSGSVGPSMRLVLRMNRLDERAGSETYLLTIAASLERLGRAVWLHSIDDAEESTLAARTACASRGGTQIAPSCPRATKRG